MAHTTILATPVVERWLEWEMAQSTLNGSFLHKQTLTIKLQLNPSVYSNRMDPGDIVTFVDVIRVLSVVMFDNKTLSLQNLIELQKYFNFLAC